MICGLSDVEIAGNQSLKNTVKYLAEFGHKIKVFTFMPTGYASLHDPKLLFTKNVEFYRLRQFLLSPIKLSKLVRDSIGRRKGVMSKSGEIANSGTYLREYNALGRILFVIFLFFIYLPFEFVRVLYYSHLHKPDLLYGVNCQGAVVASLLSRLLRIPNITRYHGVAITEDELNLLKKRILILDEVIGLKLKAEAIVMTNDGTKGKRVLELLNVDPGKIHFWINGLDIDDLILPKKWNPRDFLENLGLENKKVIMMLTRLAPWKGVDKGINCMYRLIKELGIWDAVLIIVGDGPERERLESLAKKLGIQDNVLFLGEVPNKEVALYFSIADVYMNLYEVSNLGNPLLEALYFGLPVVTINDGSTSDLLIDGENALLVDFKRLEDSLPLCVKSLLEDKALRERLGSNAKSLYQSKIVSWKKRIELENRLLISVIEGRNESRSPENSK